MTTHDAVNALIEDLVRYDNYQFFDELPDIQKEILSGMLLKITPRAFQWDSLINGLRNNNFIDNIANLMADSKNLHEQASLRNQCIYELKESIIAHFKNDIDERFAYIIQQFTYTRERSQYE